MGLAFEMARAALRLRDRDNPVVAMVAKRIIELAKAGERDPTLLCDRTLSDLGGAPPQGGRVGAREQPGEVAPHHAPRALSTRPS
jgi:hypothetical protein